LKQIQLLMLRHRVVTASLAALLLISIGFIWKVLASERIARQSLATAQIALADGSYKRTSGHALTRQSPPQLWLIPDVTAASIRLGGHSGWAAAFLSDTMLLARGGLIEMTRYDVSKPHRPVSVGGLLGKIQTLAAAHPPSGRHAIAYTYESPATPDDVLSLWETAADAAKKRWSLPPVKPQDLSIALAFDAKGGRLLRCTSDGHIELYDSQSGKLLTKISRSVFRAVFAGARDDIAAISSTASEDGQRIHTIAVIDAHDYEIEFRDSR